MSALNLPEVVSLLQEVLADLRRLWPRFLATDLFYKAIAFAVLTPLSGLILHLFVAASGGSVIADQEILFFLLRPVGLAALIVVGAVALGIVALELACLMAIGYADQTGQRIGVWTAVRFGFVSARGVFRLTLSIVFRVLLMAAPFVIVIGLLYRQLLTRFDINYYLSERPPELMLVVILAVLLLSVLFVWMARKLLDWAIALPQLLFTDASPERALVLSTLDIRGYRVQVAVALLGWGACTALLGAIPVSLVELLGGWIVPQVRDSVTGVTAAAGFLILVFSIVNWLVTAFGSSTLALVLLRLWKRTASSATTRAVDASLAELGAVRSRFALRPGLILLSIVGFVLLAAGLGFIAIERIRLDDEVVVIAHRGAALHAPENTLASVERGILDGADYIEIDVQEDAEGRVVVLHDSDLMKVGGVDLKIWDATATRLATIDIGSWFASEFSDQRVPTLEEVLELCRGRARVTIELKYYGHNDRLEERVAEIVEALDMESEVIVMSLKRDMVAAMKSLRPDGTVGLLTAKAVGDLTRMEADFLAVNTGMATLRFVRAAQRANKDVYVWTVNDALGMSAMMSRGVDGVITDDPALAKAVLAWRQELNPAERAILSLTYWFGIDAPEPDVTTDTG